MSEISAWRLQLDEQYQAAIGQYEMVHVLPDIPETFRVPTCPFYCKSVLIWEDTAVPIMDLVARVKNRPSSVEGYILAIVAYQAQPGSSKSYGALTMRSAPKRIQVNAAQACSLDDDAWAEFSISCFSDAGTAVPILNLARIFSGRPAP